jgi:hypothetical protein
MKEIIAQALPELVEFGFTDSRVHQPITQSRIKHADNPQLCWYTDSTDNNVSTVILKIGYLAKSSSM